MGKHEKFKTNEQSELITYVATKWVWGETGF
jgi:hypothetical protein